MSETNLNDMICLKQYISDQDYKEINELQEICCSKDKINLKLELDYKLSTSIPSETGMRQINEFLYYSQNKLVSYLGIMTFGNSKIGEINGMTHPDYRRKGFFQKLFKLAMEECATRTFNKILLLTDENSSSGINFIHSVQGEYDCSEYRMQALHSVPLNSSTNLILRKAELADAKEIGKQNAIYFNDPEVSEENENDIDKPTLDNTYLILLDFCIIGKICVEYTENTAFIYGFGILPEYRGKGLGRAALNTTLCHIRERGIQDISLDVSCQNKTALTLYTSCGFEKQSVMDYFIYK